MKVIIAGSRNFNDYQAMIATIHESGFDVTEVVSGKASGADTLGERYALERKIPVKEFPALWDLYGKGAGPIRNGQMADYAEALIAFPIGESRGTRNMIAQAMAKGLKVYVKECSEKTVQQG